MGGCCSVSVVVVSAVHAALTSTHQREGHAQFHKSEKENKQEMLHKKLSEKL